MSDVVSVTEAALLARDQDIRPWQQAFVVVVQGRLTRDQVITRVGERIGYAPRFRRRVLGVLPQGWVDDEGFAIAGHVREATLAPGQRLEDWLAERMGRPLDRGHPLWDAWLVHGLGEGLTALVVRSHPALVDGYDNVHLLQELLDEHPTEIDGAPPPWRPSQTSPPGLPDLLGGLRNPVQAALDVVAGLGGMVENAARTLGAQDTPRFVAGVEVDLDVLADVREAFGCTTHDVLVSLATAGVRGWLVDNGRELRDLVALVPLAIAEDDVLESAIGCRIAPQWIGLPISETSPGQRLRAVATLTRARIDTGHTVPASDLVDLAGFAAPTLHSVAAGTVAAGRPHEVFISNAPGARDPRFLGQAKVAGVYTLTGTTDEQEFSVSITSHRGRVTFGVTAVSPLRRFARDVGDELGALRAGARR